MDAPSVPVKTEHTAISVRSTSQSSHEAVQQKNERLVTRKVDWHILPIIFWLGIVSSLDAVNIGNARVQGIEKSLHMVGQQFSVAVVVFYIPCILFALPSNVLLSISRPSLFLAGFTLLGGVVTICQGVTQSYAGLIVCRLLLGICQTGIQAGIIYFLAAWYPRYVLQTRMASFLACRLIANAFAGLLAYAIAHMDGIAGYSAWRWLFILEGILMAVSLVPALLLPGWPTQARFLQPDEKHILLEMLKADTDADASAANNHTLLREVIRDPKVYYNAAIHFCSTAMSSSSIVFLPLILKELGWLAIKAQYMTIPVYLTAFVLVVANGIAADHFKRRYPFCAGALIFVIIAYSIFLAAQHVSVGVRFMACFFLISGNFAAQSTTLTWLSNNVVGKKRRGITLGAVTTLGNCGYILGSNVFLAKEAPWYPTGYGVCLALAVLALTAATAQVFHLSRVNKHRRGNSDAMSRSVVGSPLQLTL